VKDAYRFTAKWYDSLFEPINQGLRLIGLRMFLPKAGMSILDVGCGTGAHLEFYQRFDCDLSGIDPSPAMLAQARNRLGDTADLYLGSATEMPYPDSAFDLVVSMLVLHEMDHDIRLGTLAEIHRVLKDDGKVLLIDFNPGRPQGWEGWRTKTVIFFSELAAGWDHFRNYRHFMRINGLEGLYEKTGLNLGKKKVVGGGQLALILLEKRGPNE
jgi:ubiquinone/menaquinone biosynthesis C-methylase UbiE